MNIRQLIYFCKVVDMGGLTHAARTLDVAANAISMQLAVLEGELGAELFDRRTRPMVLTSFGHFFYPRAQDLVSKLRALEQDSQFFLKEQKSTLNVGFTRSVMFNILPECIRSFSTLYKDTKITLTEAVSESQVELLADKKIDIGIARELDKSPQHFGGVCAQLLCADPLVAVLPREHYLAHKTSICIQDLLRSTVILYPGGNRSAFAEALGLRLHQNSCRTLVSQHANDIYTALGLVSAGVGVSIVGHSVISNNRNDLVFKSISNFSCDSYIFALTRDFQNCHFAESFVDVMRQVISKFSGDSRVA